MGKVIAITNQKGGVGKTTTTLNLASALTTLNKKVLVIDMDYQANATLGLGIDTNLIQYNIFDLLIEDVDIKKVIIKDYSNQFDVITSSQKLIDAYSLLFSRESKEHILKKKLISVKEYYDYILIDCPPTLGIVVDNALFASDSVIIPVECEYYAYEALAQMVKQINQVQKIKNNYEENILIEGVLLNKLDNRNLYGYKIIEKVKELFPDKTFKTIINRSTHIQEAPMHGKTVINYAINSRGSKEYIELAKELIENNME